MKIKLLDAYAAAAADEEGVAAEEGGGQVRLGGVGHDIEDVAASVARRLQHEYRQSAHLIGRLTDWHIDGNKEQSIGSWLGLKGHFVQSGSCFRHKVYREGVVLADLQRDARHTITASADDDQVRHCGKQLLVATCVVGVLVCCQNVTD